MNGSLQERSITHTSAAELLMPGAYPLHTSTCEGNASCIYPTHTRGGTTRSGDVVKAIRKAGWAEVRQTGSHEHFRHPTMPGTVTVPLPKADMAIGTLKGIEKQSGVKLT